MAKKSKKSIKLPRLGLLYLDYVLRFFDRSNFRGWPDKIEEVVYHWGNDKERFIREVKKKKIDVLIGNIPATAYEAFRQIARELPDVQFIPSLDAQFCNKSKENVTRFCQKYKIPIPKTEIIYDPKKADKYLKSCSYPKIIKRSYGPSNYGGYFVHKVDSKKEAKALLEKKKYHPLYIQDFIPMEADIRVMLIGHKPVCAFWRRPPKGEWLTNTSQGGTMDYTDVPKSVLDLSVKVSKAANAEYWACDIAVGKDGKLRILECATAFAAFPYIRDWIGQYLMWKLSDGYFKKPHIPLYNWEELSKIDKSLLRTMRYITFGKYTPSYDGEYFLKDRDYDSKYLIGDTKESSKEEWPSEIYNYQGRFPKSYFQEKVATKQAENNEEISALELQPDEMEAKLLEVLEKEVKVQRIMENYEPEVFLETLQSDAEKFLELKGIFKKHIKKLKESFEHFLNPSEVK